MSDDIAIRPMTAADVPATVTLLADAGLSGGSGNLARYVAWQPACGWVAVDGEQLIGSVTVLQWGRVGFVGCMAVAAARQGRGLGGRLLEHAQTCARRAGVTTFLLEATPAGEPVYARLGYVVTGESMIAAREASGPPAVAMPTSRVTYAEIAELDRAATGLDRGDLLRGLLAEGGPGCVVRGAGYGIVVGQRLGPVIARDAGAGRAIVEALVAPCTVVAASLANEAAVDALTACGFREARHLRRMQLGAPVVGAIAEHVWAMASPGAG